MKTRGLWSVYQRLGNIVKIIKQYGKENKEITILEVGCGYGKAMKQLQEKLPKIKIIGMNYKRYKEQIPNQKYIYGDAGEKIPLQDNSIDFIYSIATMPFIKNRAKFFEEAFRVLKPKGELRVNLAPDLGAEFKEFRNPDLIVDKDKNLNLVRYLENFGVKSIIVNKSKGYKALQLKKKSPGAGLSLGLTFKKDNCINYGDFFGKKYQGFVRNYYIRE